MLYMRLRVLYRPSGNASGTIRESTFRRPTCEFDYLSYRYLTFNDESSNVRYAKPFLGSF